MRLLTPVWIIIAGVWIAHASGFISQLGNVFQGVDQAIGTVTDIRKLTHVTPVLPNQARVANKHVIKPRQNAKRPFNHGFDFSTRASN